MGKDKLKAYVSEYGTDFSTDGHVCIEKCVRLKLILKKSIMYHSTLKWISTKKMLDVKMIKHKENANNS